MVDAGISTSTPSLIRSLMERGSRYATPPPGYPNHGTAVPTTARSGSCTR